MHTEPKTSLGHWRPTHLQTGTKALCSTWLTRLTGHEAQVRPSQAGCHTAARGAAASTPRITDSSRDSSLTRGKWSATSIESARLNKSQRQRRRKGGARVKSKEAADLQPRVLHQWISRQQLVWVTLTAKLDSQKREISSKLILERLSGSSSRRVWGQKSC